MTESLRTEFNPPKVTVFDHTVEGYLQLNAFYNYVIKREIWIREWREDAHNLRELLKSHQDLVDRLEAVREFVLGRRNDIEDDIEDLGILKPALIYFLEEKAK